MAETQTDASEDFEYGDPVARWFVREAYRITDTAALIAATGEQLVAAGIPLYRLGYFQLTLHPSYLGTGYFWRRGRGVESAQAPHSLIGTSDYLDNPLPRVFEGGGTQRVRLEGDAEVSFPVLRQLKAEGATDYVAMPVIFTDGHIDALSVTSDKPGGFSRQDLDRMYALSFLFARIMEIHSRRTTAINLLDTYVGHQAGERVLEGRILRGDGETIHAVLWYCDMRGFTPLSDWLPRDDLIALLNDYFGCMAAAVQAHGGEVLKFIGDAMLAVFPIADALREQAVCDAALAAAAEAIAGAAALNQARKQDGRPVIEFGLALHVGDVLYGNIGAEDRLDFTVIGPAVNLVTRIEQQTRVLNEPVLLSADFAERLRERARPLGAHRLKGVAEPQAIWAPRETARTL